MAINPVVMERASRDIYLLPFMLAIKMSKPGAIMTADNRVNGTHASESERPLQETVRDEWKWKGVVTSDWYVDMCLK